ncbi:MAG: nucleotidyltransferase domain-containing protein [Candidatus Delongbacteria bacterium]|nr:nucleotidyltransferase domain-containing protein [Candidatus Delongbacteria bacterium]
MKNCTEELLKLIKKITKVYSEREEIKAIAVTGSVSRGNATEYSDTDIVLIYNKLPPDDFFTEAFKINRGENREIFGKDEDGMAEQYYVDGVEYQFAHGLPKYYDETFDKLLNEYSIDPTHQHIADSFGDILPIYGEEYINSLKSRLKDFPEELQIKLVERYLRFGPFDELKYRFQKKENIIWTTDVLSIYVKRIIATLLGVNKKFIPYDFRKIERVIDGLEHKPDDLYNRIHRLFEFPRINALDDLYKLKMETIEIVEKNLPRFDTAKVRNELVRSQSYLNI